MAGDLWVACTTVTCGEGVEAAPNAQKQCLESLNAQQRAISNSDSKRPILLQTT